VFEATVTTLGYVKLATIAGSPPTLNGMQVACGTPPAPPVPPPPPPKTETGLIEHVNPHDFLWTPGGGGSSESGGCLNPSCTKM